MSNTLYLLVFSIYAYHFIGLWFLLLLPLLVLARMAWSMTSLLGTNIKYRSGNQFLEALEQAKAGSTHSSTQLPPDPEQIPSDDFPSLACNHFQEFTISQGRLFYRPLSTPPQAWQMIPLNSERIPCTISVDGANLVVQDEEEECHYKKVLLETRDGDSYNLQDCALTFPWINDWMIFDPMTSFELSEPGRLKFKRGLQFAVSHRGQYNHFFTDAKGDRFPVGMGCTSLFVLQEDGKTIRVYDPWKPQNLRVCLNTPQTAKSSFRAFRLSAAASVVAVLGYEYSVDTDRLQLALYTRLSDVDVLGWNPFLEYTYNPKCTSNEHRLLPFQGWRKHSLPQGHISTTLKLQQTGRGNESRLLRLSGTCDAQSGYWEKGLDEEEWNFRVDPNAPTRESIPPPPTDFTLSAANFSGSGKIGNVPVVAEIRDWSALQDEVPCKLICAGKSAELQLVRKEALIGRIFWSGGADCTTWHLVCSKPDTLPKQLQSIFNGNFYLSVDVNAQNGKLRVKSSRGIAIEGTLLSPEFHFSQPVDLTLTTGLLR